MNPNKRKSTILVVEDDDASRLLISAILEDFPVNIIETTSGTEALWIIKKFQKEIDLLFLDIVLPDSNGFILLMQSRLILGDVPALALSAIPPYELEFKSKIVGFNKWISKPIEVAELKEIIHSMLS